MNGAHIHEHCAWLTADVDDARHTEAASSQAAHELAQSLWDLDGWADDARQLLAELRDLPPDALAEGFVLSAAVLRHLTADPLLPPALLPSDWPGDELRSTYHAWDRAYRQVLATWHRAQRG